MDTSALQERLRDPSPRLSAVTEEIGRMLKASDEGRGQVIGRLKLVLDSITWHEESDALERANCADALASQASVLKRLQDELSNEDRSHGETVDDRDFAEKTLARVARAVGCEEEWSSAHYHGDCIIDAYEAIATASEREGGDGN